MITVKMALLLVVAGFVGAWLANSCSDSAAAEPNAGHVHFIEYDQDPLGGTQFLVYCDRPRHNLLYVTDFNRATSKSPALAVVSGGC